MNAEKRENNEESASSDVDGGGDSSAEGNLNAAATIPKKRGRPSKANKVEKVPSGRGRGRPAKSAVADDGGSDDSAVENGSKRPAGNGRGRPKSIKPKDPLAKKSGRGRGRPKNPKRSTVDDDDDGEDEILPKKVKIGGKRPGRPRKAQATDDEPSDEEKKSDEDERVVRPTGGLNIQRTGRGQGRPKKIAVETVKKVVPDGSPRKRGRPPTKTAGSARGRPKAAAASSADEDDDDSKDEENEDDSLKGLSKGEDSVEEVDDDYSSPEKKHRELASDELAAA